MDNPFTVGKIQTLAHLDNDVDNLFQGPASALLNQTFQSLSLEKLHGDIGCLLVLSCIIHGDHVWMDKFAGGSDFALESRDQFFNVL